MNNHVISIHALLAESDTPPYNLMIHHKNFYPRSPCGERLEQSSSYNAYLEEFLSTLSLRRATQYFRKKGRTNNISIHALLAESDNFKSCKGISYFIFLSTLSLRRATLGQSITLRLVILFLSTLSLRRATHAKKKSTRQTKHFYPRSPCGERHHRLKYLYLGQHFYPRSPCGERPNQCKIDKQCSSISIHALLAESDF